jgi:tetratricopeptide (TPR) repeat protein
MVDRIARSNTSLAGGRGSISEYYELAGLKLSRGDIDGAIAAYDMCLTIDGRNAAVYNNLGAALVRAQRFDEAVVALETAIGLQPGYQRPLVNLGKALRGAGRLAESLARLREALASQPDYPPALINLGETLAANGEIEAALAALERAIEVAPQQVEAHMTLGVVLLQSGRTRSALDSLHAAVRLAPDNADAHSNLAHALFYAGDWAAAWPHFEYRFQRLSHRVKLRAPAGMAPWAGAIGNDEQLWLIGEQGLGDQLQFARYAKLLHARGIDCVLACESRLQTLLSHAQLASRVVSFEGCANSPSKARWCPLMSVPAWHKTQPINVPHADGYLRAEPLRIDAWRSRLPPTPDLSVALVWAGNPAMETGLYRGRSPALASLEPLMEVRGVRFISLQKGAGESQLDQVSFAGSILRFPTLDTGAGAFLDTAAVLKCVDLLVTSDTAAAHLAGALGVPTWLCLTHDPDWRWMGTGARTPWYSSMRLFRQTVTGDWRGLYREVARALEQVIRERRRG